MSPIRGAGTLGEVLVAIRGGTELYIARATEPIEAGATVLIIAVDSGRIADVVAWVPLVPDPLD
ncbi:hypothetical protein GV794_12220 [Nocardia cyriacigeorgica]|uniref:Uncharacterized protein n=1 Tax=Nocardia cyriacigeorgica TaxID=135487 RepID=A0A6P1D0J6_9NOCA|nr:hypothetical protein [Nocardia cyriacigeorgica]NEW37943.1 hypothetical protein [Nocardia cyriacigeorgica]NEW42851.1 hypothetical protein [Nocardia cyriacigeorgica]NEW48674.1 hypothetical protein [Nocardia cyriacigeorgica]NEW56410.1 hypothetical protein [Nocardia cyriacigeorgica]